MAWHGKAGFTLSMSLFLLVQLSPEGSVLRYLDDNDGSHVATISAVTEIADKLYLGNLGGDFVSYLQMSDMPAVAASR